MTQQKAILNLDSIIKKIEFARLQNSDHHIVQLVAISKYSTSDDIRTMYNSGQRAFGENKVQDLKLKQQQLEDLPIAWHFVGTLQKNKINNLIDLDPVLMHSLDSYDLAWELDKKLKLKNKTMNCLLQINSAYEDTKSGVDPKNATEIYKKIQNDFSNIKLKGVMSIGAHTTSHEDIIKSFQTTKSIYDSIDGQILSMGMSSDFELAILNGSNMIRVGSSLFQS
ncbi:MAG: YggS family pyridoxal phosphate-dependent enzyme [Campylobacterales bacterium]|nr:YggS family pyridoxal phosphate-dependent enzyme [Campylobacterales bacterium]